MKLLITRTVKLNIHQNTAKMGPSSKACELAFCNQPHPSLSVGCFNAQRRSLHSHPFNSPSFMQQPILGNRFRKHTLNMHGTSPSGGSADPATQQKNWLCALQHVVIGMHLIAQHPQHKHGVFVLQQTSASKQSNVSCAAQPMLLNSGMQPS